ncbi:hypothetical protein [Glycomyces harbinensis]|uniref:hypothetical protein n=1 Tax=Glycomyces harbinensis TaxID=58114 RepID=UPI00115F8174|nr:hypothetical protein [Glycomyces harbinensis]
MSEFSVQTFFLSKKGSQVSLADLAKIPDDYPGHQGSIGITVEGKEIVDSRFTCTIDVLWDQVLLMEDRYLRNGASGLDGIFDWAYSISMRKVSHGLLVIAEREGVKNSGIVVDEGEFLREVNRAALNYYSVLIGMRENLRMRYIDMYDLVKQLELNLER